MHNFRKLRTVGLLNFICSSCDWYAQNIIVSSFQRPVLSSNLPSLPCTLAKCRLVTCSGITRAASGSRSTGSSSTSRNLAWIECMRIHCKTRKTAVLKNGAWARLGVWGWKFELNIAFRAGGYNVGNKRTWRDYRRVHDREKTWKSSGKLRSWMTDGGPHSLRTFCTQLTCLQKEKISVGRRRKHPLNPLQFPPLKQMFSSLCSRST